jgi:LAO/AO transport system kinase
MSFDRRLLGKSLSKIASASVDDILRDVAAEAARHTRVIGVTGSPGAGKSTLIGRLAARRLDTAATVAIVAIDPTSPRSDGSVLGDRIRMGELGEDPRVYIRSLPSRSSEDGLTENVGEIVAALDRFGFTEVIIETVGAGQSAYGVRVMADVEVLVLSPGAGDYVQAMKAGIMETADVYVVNKSDQPGASRLVSELMGVLPAAPGEQAPIVIQTRFDEDGGVVNLSNTLDRLLSRPVTPEQLAMQSGARRRYRIQQLVQRRVQEIVKTLPDGCGTESMLETYRRVIQSLIANRPPR